MAVQRYPLLVAGSQQLSLLVELKPVRSDSRNSGCAVAERKYEAPSVAQTAYHEAGHAVACYWLQEEPFEDVTIIPDERSDSHGRMSWSPGPRLDRLEGPGALSPDDRVWIDRTISILLAGGIAEERFSGQYDEPGTEGDRRCARELSDYVVPGACVAVGELDLDLDPEVLAERVQNSPEQLRRQAYFEWRRLETEHLVASRWANIQAVAEALLVRGQLTYAEVKALIDPEGVRHG